MTLTTWPQVSRNLNTHTHTHKNHAQFIDKWIHFLNIWLEHREKIKNKNSLETTGSMQHFQSGIVHYKQR